MATIAAVACDLLAMVRFGRNPRIRNVRLFDLHVLADC